MDKYEEMRTFVHIVDAGGISHAANRLDIAKSAVSRRLNDLEARLQVQLFNRSTRKLSITDTGRSYYQQCLRLLNDLNEVESSLCEDNAKLTGTLRIAAPLSFGLSHLGDVIKRFIHDHPEIKIDLSLDDRRVNIIEEHFDVALRIGVLEDSQLFARKLFTLNLIPVASANFLKIHGIPRTAKDLEKLPLVSYPISSNYLQYSDAKGNTGKIKPNIIHACNNGSFNAELVSNDIGYCILPSFIAYKYIENNALVPLLCDYSWGNESAYAVYPSNRHLSQRVRTFIDFLVISFENVPYWDKCIDSIKKRNNFDSN